MTKTFRVSILQSPFWLKKLHEKKMPLTNAKRLTTAKIWKEITDLQKEYRHHPSRPSLSHKRNLKSAP
jgi:hypothetical protein